MQSGFGGATAVTIPDYTQPKIMLRRSPIPDGLVKTDVCKATRTGAFGVLDGVASTSWRRILPRLGAQSLCNAAATMVRAGSRTVWSLAIPAFLSVRSFGQYALLQTTVATVGQICLMGSS